MIENMIRLDSPIADLKGFGPKSAEKFTKLDLHTVGDLLLYFPFRYENYTIIISNNQQFKKN
mgnify:CR=1 FL=1